MRTTDIPPIISKALGIDEQTARLYCKRLRETGFLPTGSGRTAAEATIEHAAILIYALMVGPGPTLAERAFRSRGWQHRVRDILETIDPKQLLRTELRAISFNRTDGFFLLDFGGGISSSYGVSWSPAYEAFTISRSGLLSLRTALAEAM